MGNKIRKPQQQRSIEKRNRIIEAGFQLFCEKGYHNTNTAEIAKSAGVSTGIVYSYFKDKKDIFILSVENYANNVAAPLFGIFKNLKAPYDMEMVIRQIIDGITSTHTMIQSVHEEMQAMSHTDEDIRDLNCNFHKKLADSLVSAMQQLDINPTNAHEKTHIIINLVENLIHEKLYHSHDYLNYQVMTDEVVKIIIHLIAT